MTQTDSLSRKIAWKLFALEREVGDWNEVTGEQVIQAIAAELAEREQKWEAVRNAALLRTRLANRKMTPK